LFKLLILSLFKILDNLKIFRNHFNVRHFQIFLHQSLVGIWRISIKNLHIIRCIYLNSNLFWVKIIKSLRHSIIIPAYDSPIDHQLNITIFSKTSRSTFTFLIHDGHLLFWILVSYGYCTLYRIKVSSCTFFVLLNKFFSFP